MSSLASIVVLLQLVLSLLSNQNLSPAAKVQASALATQVIGMATLALQQSPTTSSVPTPSSETGLGAPDISSIVTPSVTPTETATSYNPQPNGVFSARMFGENYGISINYQFVGLLPEGFPNDQQIIASATLTIGNDTFNGLTGTVPMSDLGCGTINNSIWISGVGILPSSNHVTDYSYHIENAWWENNGTGHLDVSCPNL